MLGLLVYASCDTTEIVNVCVSDVCPDNDAVMVTVNVPEEVGVPDTVLPLTLNHDAPETEMVHPDRLVDTTYENGDPVIRETSPCDDSISTGVATHFAYNVVVDDTEIVPPGEYLVPVHELLVYHPSKSYPDLVGAVELMVNVWLVAVVEEYVWLNGTLETPVAFPL